MLNASQVRTKRAAFTDESMSSTPASARGWFADDADGVAAEAREAADDVLRAALVHLEEVAVVDDARRSRRFMSYGLFGLSGNERVELRAPRGRADRRLGERRRVEVVLRQEREEIARVVEAGLLVGRDEVRDAGLRVACVAAPPSSSNVTSSPVTVFTTSGPVMNMYEVPSTMKMKSVIAGE